MQVERIVRPRRRLVVGSWPGPSFSWNTFIAAFCDALAAAGCEVVDVDDPRRISRKLDVLHIHWPEQIFWKGGGSARTIYRTVITLHALARLKRSGVRIVWMVHNLKPHELSGVRRPLWRLIERRLTALADGFMTLSPATVRIVREALPGLKDTPYASPWHPAYPLAGPLPDRAASRHAAGLPPTGDVYAFLGLVRAYKGVGDLIAAFRDDPAPERRLLIAGHCDSAEYGAELQRLAVEDRRIHLRLGRLDEADFAMLTAAADVIVLPFRDYLHSGSMIHTLSHARPVITPSAPFADALAAEVGDRWVRTYQGKLTAADLASAERPIGEPDLSGLSGAAMAAAAIALYERLVVSHQRDNAGER